VEINAKQEMVELLAEYGAEFGNGPQPRQSIGSEALPESDREDDRASRSGQPSPDGSLEARKREDSAPIVPTITSDETASQKAPSTTQTLRITLSQGVSTPERTGTPTPNLKPSASASLSRTFNVPHGDSL
jgi:hypothetical protein